MPRYLYCCPSVNWAVRNTQYLVRADGGTITQTGVVAANSLGLRSTGAIMLNNAANNRRLLDSVDALTAYSEEEITYAYYIVLNEPRTELKLPLLQKHFKKTIFPQSINSTSHKFSSY